MRTQIILACLAASCSVAALAAPQGWTISESSGPVQVSRNGIVKVAARGGAVSPGDTVTTGNSGRAVLVRGTEYMMVAPRSQLRLPAIEQSNGFTQIFEDFGNVVFMIKKKMTPHFEVKTPYLAAVVKGTTFTVGVSPKGAAVQVLEGAVDVATGDGGAHELLLPGAVALVGADNLYRLKVEANGTKRIIDSPAAPAEQTAPVSPPAPTPGASADSDASSAGAPASGATAAAPASAVISTPVLALTETVYAAPASLANTTNGLVTGTIGGDFGRADVAGAATASIAAAEASRSVARAVVVVETLSDARDEEVKSGAISDKLAADADAAAKMKSDTDAAAKQAEDAARQSGEEASKAAAATAKAEADSVNAKAAAEAAATAAAAAAEEATLAAADESTKAAARARADRDASEAARVAKDVAEKAARDAAKAAEEAAAGGSGDADKIAKESAKDAEKAAKEARKAAEDAAKAADEADRAKADKITKDAEKAAKEAAADRAGKDAAKVAEDATKAAADKTTKDAEKAAKDAADQAAKAASDAAKQQEKAAKDAQKAAEDATKESKKAAEDAAKEADDNAKKLEKILKGKKG